MSFAELTSERKKYLKVISKLSGGRDIIVYASDLTNKTNSPISIDNSDILPWQDQLANLKGTSIDVIIETPGGLQKLLRTWFGYCEINSWFLEEAREWMIDGSMTMLSRLYQVRMERRLLLNQSGKRKV
ncbi:MAG: hypothetical protein ABIR18_08985 [Chitinophagaceae bacterium]